MSDTTIRYSGNPDGPWTDDIEDIFDHVLEGDTYYAQETRPINAGDILTENVLESILDRLDGQWFDLFQFAEDPVDPEFSLLPQTAKDELKTLIAGWINKQRFLQRHWIADGKPEERTVTAKDMMRYI